MKIKPITKYPFKGREYESLKDIQNKIHDIIGEEVLDRFNKNCEIRHKDLFRMLEIICMPEVRKVLTECLNVTFDKYEDDEEEPETINILDLK